MKRFSFKPEIWNYLEEDSGTSVFYTKCFRRIRYMHTVMMTCFMKYYCPHMQKKRMQETGLVYLTRRQMNMPGFSLRKTLAEHGRHGFIILDEIPED